VQAKVEPIGATVDATREALSWLGRCQREQAGHSTHLAFKFTPEVDSQVTLKLKIEIHTCEHTNLLGIKRYPFELKSECHQGKTEIASFEPEELFGAKLRALLQRRASRDPCDLHQGLEQLALAPEKVLACFHHCLALEGKPITRATAKQRMLEQLIRSLTEDITPLLSAGIRFEAVDAIDAFERVWSELIAKIGGECWKLAQTVLEELRVKRFPGLLASRARYYWRDTHGRKAELTSRHETA
jgi:hypothetical protein